VNPVSSVVVTFGYVGSVRRLWVVVVRPIALVDVVAAVGVAVVLVVVAAVVGVVVTVAGVTEVVLVACPHPSAKPVTSTSNRPMNTISLICPVHANGFG
jgi:hypothetical protein